MKNEVGEHGKWESRRGRGNNNVRMRAGVCVRQGDRETGRKERKKEGREREKKIRVDQEATDYYR